MAESWILLPFSEGRGVGSGRDRYFDGKHVTLAMRGATFPIVLRILTEKDDFAREDSQKPSGAHGVFDGSTRQAK